MTTKKKLHIELIIVIAAVAIISVLVPIGLIGIMLWGSINAKPEVYDEIKNYTEYGLMN